MGAGSPSIRCSTGNPAGGNGCSVAHVCLHNNDEPSGTDEALCHNDEAEAPLSPLNEVVHKCVKPCNDLSFHEAAESQMRHCRVNDDDYIVNDDVPGDNSLCEFDSYNNHNYCLS